MSELVSDWFRVGVQEVPRKKNIMIQDSVVDCSLVL